MNTPFNLLQKTISQGEGTSKTGSVTDTKSSAYGEGAEYAKLNTISAPTITSATKYNDSGKGFDRIGKNEKAAGILDGRGQRERTASEFRYHHFYPKPLPKGDEQFTPEEIAKESNIAPGKEAAQMQYLKHENAQEQQQQ